MELKEEILRSPVDYFIATRRTESTRKNYRYSYRRVLGNADAFLERAKGDKKYAEEFLTAWILERRDRLSTSSLTSPLSAIKSFLDYNDVFPNWKRIYSLVGPARTIARDRAPTTAEIRRVLDIADLRTKTMILIFVSSGIREEAITLLKMRDLKFLDSGISKLNVYAGENEEYETFISEEATKTFQSYLEAREQIGERIVPDAPVIRNVWNWSKHINNRDEVHTRLDSANPKPITIQIIQNTMGDLWIKCGVRDKSDTRIRKDFKSVHGFRKYFKTHAGTSISNRDDVEVLMGHKKNYYIPTIEHLEEVYLKGQSALIVSEVQDVKQKREADVKVHNEEINDVRLVLMEKDQQLQRLQGIVEEMGEEHKQMKADWNNEIKPELERLRKAAKQN